MLIRTLILCATLVFGLLPAWAAGQVSYTNTLDNLNIRTNLNLLQFTDPGLVGRTSNGTAVVVLTNNQTYLSVARFGVLPTGSDVTAEFQLACGYSLSNNTALYIPRGAYMINNPNFLIGTNQSVILIGAGSSEVTFTGDGGEDDTMFRCNGTLKLSGIKVSQVERLVSVNSLLISNTVANITLKDVVVDNTGMSYINGGILFYGSTGPFTNSIVTLDMDGCSFTSNADNDHINLRCGFRGAIRNSTFIGGKRGIYNIPTADPGSVGGNANVWSPDVVIDRCEFGPFNYTGTSDSYAIQAAGERWKISNTVFKGMAGTGATSSGHVYSNLKYSTFIGCSFLEGGFSMFFAKGNQRSSPATDVTAGDGWGNVFEGCTFSGYGSASSQLAQVYMNVKEQLFSGCVFTNWLSDAFQLNSQAPSDNFRVVNCRFDNGQSRTAFYIDAGGTNINITGNIFTAGVGSSAANARVGIITFDGAAEGQSWSDVTIRDNTFIDIPVYAFQLRDTNSTLTRFQWVNNKVYGPNISRGMSASGSASGVTQLNQFTFTDNYYWITNFAWNTMPLISSDSSSARNTFVQGGASSAATGFPLGGTILYAGDTNVIDLTYQQRTNLLSSPITFAHVTNGVTGMTRSQTRWLLNTSGGDVAFSIPAAWIKLSDVPAALTNGVIYRMFVEANGLTSSSALQSNVFVRFDWSR